MVSKIEMSKMRKKANEVLKLQGIDPDTYRYEQDRKIVLENLEFIFKEMQKREVNGES